MSISITFICYFCFIVVVEHMDQNLMTFLLTAVCSPNHFKNPYLVSKLVEVLFVINPSVQDRTDTLFMRVMSHPISEEHLPSALMTFYTDVEQTGASSEFYDKFTIRYHISIIMKSMWESPVHKIAIINESKSGKQFVKFINMLMNDTTFLLGKIFVELKFNISLKVVRNVIYTTKIIKMVFIFLKMSQWKLSREFMKFKKRCKTN